MEQQHLHILWATGDALTANFMVLQYAINCLTQDWWDAVTVVLWGSSAQLLAEDEGLQQRVRCAQHVGVRFAACNAGARQLGVTGALEALDVEVRGWGGALTELLQTDKPLLVV